MTNAVPTQAALTSRDSSAPPKLSERFEELLRYRHLLRMLVTSELKLRYRRSTLGFLWSLLNPLLMMTVLSVVFSIVMRFQVRDYALMLLAGILPWTFIAQSVNGSLMSLVSKGSLLHKVYVPKTIFPLSTVFANLINFILSLFPLLLIGIIVGHKLSWALLFLPISVTILAVFACGLALFFSCMNVFFRDFTHMTEVLLQALFYASPIVYDLTMVPEHLRDVFRLNPMTSIIECFRGPIYRGTLPSSRDLLIAAAAALCALLVGLYVFLKREDEFVFRV